MLGPGDDLSTLDSRGDHLGILRYVRAHQLREPELVINHGKALLGLTLSKRLNDTSARAAALEQICLASLDVHDHELAELCLKELTVHVTKESSRYRRLLARCLEAADDTDGAMIIYDDLLKENPANVLALQRKYCILRAKQMSAPVVIEALNEYLGQQLSDVSGWYEMAHLRLTLADYKGAAFALEQVVLGSPLESDLHRELAEVYATMGGLDNVLLARKHMAQALELEPDNIRAQFGLISIANQYLDESNEGSKKALDEHERLVAKELVQFGTNQILTSYKGTKMLPIVKRVMDDCTANAED